MPDPPYRPDQSDYLVHFTRDGAPSSTILVRPSSNYPRDSRFSGGSLGQAPYIYVS